MRDEEITAHALAAGRGDSAAITEFVRGTQADVWRYVAYLVDRSTADDLTQETFLRALRGLRTFRGDVPARIWLLSIARRAVVDHFRAQGRRPQSGASLDCGEFAAELLGPIAADHAGNVAIEALIATLDEDKRTAFVLTQISGLSYAEAAQIAGVPVGTIRSRVARAREDLIAAMEADGPALTPRQPRRLHRPF
ncbi:MAG: sigma-70 family RNA polymerase sigma factor [Sporichthyaceae bacterium]